ncbi:MAG: hypothetical protein ABJB86_19390 [Bacteroidota bacterium]
MNTGYLVQGLRNNTLVAGKTTALRILISPASAISVINLILTRPNGSVLRMGWSGGQLVRVDTGLATESIVVLIPGKNMPDVGSYYLRAQLINANGIVAGTCTIDNAVLLPTKDLRIMVSRVWSNTGPAAKPGEVEDAVESLKRLAALYPVRDGISTLNGDMTCGLRYNFDNNPQGPPHQDANLNPSWDIFQHPGQGQDTLDNALAYRFPDAGEGSGAITHPPYNNWLNFSVIVWQNLAQPFSHESGHHYGMEAPQSPHFDPTGQASHSKDLNIDPAEAANGFDIQFNKPFANPLFDVMFPTGPAPGRPAGDLALNSWDWEFMRNRLLKNNSTGPQAPAINWQFLAGHNLRPNPAVLRNKDGRLEVFALGGDNALYHIWENSPGGAWHAWGTLEGHDLHGPIATALNADGRAEVFVLGGDGKIWSRSQNAASGWDPWFTIGGTNIKNFAVAANADGRLEIVAIGGDGAMYDAWQNAPNGGWSGFVSIGGHGLKPAVSFTSNGDGRLEAFAIGGDGNVYHIWQNGPNGHGGWSAWSGLIDPRIVNITDLRAVLSGDGRVFVFLMLANKTMSYFMQVIPNGGWGPSTDFFGHDLQWPCAIGKGTDGRLEVSAIGADTKLYTRFQVDASRSGLWSNWTGLGGHQIQPGPGLACDQQGQIEIFIIGGDGALYRGLR